MGSSEMLLGDLRSIHGALKELLSSARPDVPSWRFPGRLSASLTLDDLLPLSPGQDDNRVILLEGIVDRLLLLLQASLKLWNEDRSLPLSLSSTVKKFCKQLLQTRDKTHSLKQRLVAREEEVSSLTLSLSEAQEQCHLLQTALDQSAHSSRPTSVLHSVVPYEARKTIKISQMVSSQSDRPTTQEPRAGTSSIRLTTTDDQTIPKCTTTVSTQTAETAFAMCVRCSSTLTALSSAGARVQELSCSLELPSQLSVTDWEREAQSGSLDPGKWLEKVESDMETIKKACWGKLDELSSLRESLCNQKSREDTLQSQLSQLSQRIRDMEERAVERERDHSRELVSCQERGSVQLREMEATQRRILEQRGRLEKQLVLVKKERDKLISSSAEIEKQQWILKRELREVQEKERALRGCQTALQGQLERLEGELAQCREEMERDRLQLNKTTTLNHTLQRKHQAGLSRQREVLDRLGEMDREAEEMRRELASSTVTRDQLRSRVDQLQTECSLLHNQVSELEERSVESAREQERLSEELAGLEVQVTSLSAELERERENCRLLVTRPELISVTGSSRDLQEHISANTIRILVLEEQNSELRESVLEHAKRTERKRREEPTKPVPLWHSDSLAAALLARGRPSNQPPIRPLLPSIARAPASPSPSS